MILLEYTLRLSMRAKFKNFSIAYLMWKFSLRFNFFPYVFVWIMINKTIVKLLFMLLWSTTKQINKSLYLI